MGSPPAGGNWPRMHDMIDRRVSAFLHGLARSQTGAQSGRLDFSRNSLWHGL